MKEVLLLKEAYRLVAFGSQLLIVTLLHDSVVRWTWDNNPYVVGHTLSCVHQTTVGLRPTVVLMGNGYHTTLLRSIASVAPLEPVLGNCKWINPAWFNLCSPDWGTMQSSSTSSFHPHSSLSY